MARAFRLLSILAFANVAVWLCSMLSLGSNLTLQAMAVLVYGLGLRHAVDADHIAAIDNVTRKFVEINQPSESVGFYFAMGHSTVVTLAALTVAYGMVGLDHIQNFRGIGGFIGAGVSAAFLLAVAAINLGIFTSTFCRYRRLRTLEHGQADNFDSFVADRGLLVRFFRPLFKLVTRPWHMFALGLLFGLSFDTATEVTMFSVSASQAVRNASISTILIFPLLFAAGMSLVDSADTVLMLGAYHWAPTPPLRKLLYNMFITFASASVAILIGGIEVMAMIKEWFRYEGAIWDMIALLSRNFGYIGFALIVLFALTWLASFLISRLEATKRTRIIP